MAFYFLFAVFEYPRECDEYSRCGDSACDEVGDAFRHVHALEAYEVREHEAQRYEYYDFSYDGEYEGGARLTERDVDVLQGHLHEKHYRAHEEQRRIRFDDRRYVGACREDVGVCLRHGERNRPYDGCEHERDERYVHDAFFEPFGVAFAVVVADERLHAVAEPVERQRYQLERAEHDGERGGIVFVAARRCVEIYIEYYLYGAFRDGHNERRYAERQYRQYAFAVWLCVLEAETEQTPLGEEEREYARARQGLGYYSCEARALYAHIEREYEDRVERDICDRAYRYRAHRDKRSALRGNERVKTLREHYENRSERVNFQVRRGELDSRRRTAESRYYLFGKKVRRYAYYYADGEEQYERGVEYPVGFGLVVLAELDACARRAAEPDEIGERLYYERDGQYYAERGERVHARAVYPRDKHPVDDVIYERDELSYHRGYGQLEHERKYFAFFELLGGVCRCVFVGHGLGRMPFGSGVRRKVYPERV